jgi:esterase/lipase superfamily enzyme
LRFAAIAPWIVDAWLEALHALSFDLPTLGVDGYQARVAIAVAALTLLALAWHSIGLLPWRQRRVAQVMLTGVLLAPVADFASSHADAMAVWRTAFTHGAVPTASDPTHISSGPDSARPSDSANLPNGPSVSLPVAPPTVQSGALGSAEVRPTSAETGTVSSRPVGSAAQASRRPNADRVRIYYGTNRTAIGRDDTVRFATTPSAQLSLGRAEIAQPWRSRRAYIDRVWPVAITPDTDIRMRATSGPLLTALSHDAFLEASVLQLATSERDTGHVLVVIPGVTMDFETSLQRAASLATELDFDGATFVFSWPTSGSAARYPSDRKAAVDAIPHLSAFLKLVAQQSGATSVSLVVHGLGTELALEAIDKIAAAMPTGTTVHNLILVAPDMARAAFVQTWGKVAGHIERTTLYAADTDRALNVSRRYAGAAPRAGDLLAGAPLLLPGLQTVDATAIGTDGAGNVGPGETPVLSIDIETRLRRTPLDISLPGTEKITTPLGSYLRYLSAAAR